MVTVVALLLVAAGCSDKSAGSANQGSAGPASASTTVDEQRIVPVNGDLAEVVWALGLGDQVVATDISATYPKPAQRTEKIGYQRALVAETVLAHEPTIVLADDLAGPPEALDQLDGTGVEVVTIERDRTLDGPAAKIRGVARALGVPGRGDELAEQVQTEIDTAVADAVERVERAPRVLALYLRGEQVQLVFGKGSGIDAVIEGAGGIDVGTEMGVDDNAPLTTEAILEARPDVLLVSRSGLESVGGVDGLLRIGGFARTPAGKTRQVHAFDDQYLYGLGPRTGQLIAELTDVFTKGPR